MLKQPQGLQGWGHRVGAQHPLPRHALHQDRFALSRLQDCPLKSSAQHGNIHGSQKIRLEKYTIRYAMPYSKTTPPVAAAGPPRPARHRGATGRTGTSASARRRPGRPRGRLVAYFWRTFWTWRGVVLAYFSSLILCEPGILQAQHVRRNCRGKSLLWKSSAPDDQPQ